MSNFYLEKKENTNELRLLRRDQKDSGIFIDFEKDFFEYQKQKISIKKDLLARALNLSQSQKICDLTMGFAQDSFKLAYLGGQVTAVEQNPLVAELVQNGLERAQSLPCLKFFKIHIGKLQDFVMEHVDEFEAFYLDPMFTHKRSALPKKDMQYLADLAEPSSDSEYLSTVSLIVQRGKRLAIKRPRQDGPLCDLKPKTSFEGKMVRFDVY